MKTYHRNNNLLTGKLGDELVIMDNNKGKYYSLNVVATRIWEIIEMPVDQETLCNLLMEEFDITSEQCKIETEECLNMLAENDFIQIID